MRVTLHPESDEDEQDIRTRAIAAKTLLEGLTDKMYWAVAAACVQWDKDHPDLFHLKPGSVISVRSGLIYVVQSDGKWAQLERPGGFGCTVKVIDPRGAEWSDATVEWSAS